MRTNPFIDIDLVIETTEKIRANTRNMCKGFELEIPKIKDEQTAFLSQGFSTGQILTHYKMDIYERLAHRIHHLHDI